jgi:hypothetical protein
MRFLKYFYQIFESIFNINKIYDWTITYNHGVGHDINDRLKRTELTENKNYMRLYEFVNNNSELLELIKDLIYFDEKWMFPKHNIKEFLESDYNITDEFFIFSEKVVNELNSNKVDVYDFENSFKNIIKTYITD